MANSLNCCLFGASRIVHVSAREELLPGWLSCWNKKLNCPKAAFCFQVFMAIAILLIINLNTVSKINEMENLTKWTQGVVVIVLLLFIRLSRARISKNIIRVNVLLPCLYLTCLLILICNVLITKWIQIILTIGVFGLPLMIYMTLVRPTGLRRIERIEQLFDKLGSNL